MDFFRILLLLFFIAGGIFLCSALIITTPILTYANSSNNNLTMTLTQNQIAAGGPVVGNLSKIEEEQNCIAVAHQGSNNRPWYPTITNTEHGGSERTGLYACADFGGSYTKPNQVYAYESLVALGGIPSYMNTREPNELYVYGGASGLALPGPYVSKMEAGSLRELWHTPLSNANVTGDWLIPGAMGFHTDGYLYAAQGPYLYKVNARTGQSRILRLFLLVPIHQRTATLTVWELLPMAHLPGGIKISPAIPCRLYGCTPRLYSRIRSEKSTNPSSNTGSLHYGV